MEWRRWSNEWKLIPNLLRLTNLVLNQQVFLRLTYWDHDIVKITKLNLNCTKTWNVEFNSFSCTRMFNFNRGHGKHFTTHLQNKTERRREREASKPCSNISTVKYENNQKYLLLFSTIVTNKYSLYQKSCEFLSVLSAWLST